MNLLNLLRRKLPVHKVIWCVGVPYNKEQFYQCCDKSNASDFIDSLELKYSSNDKDYLWSRYVPTADKISKCIKELSRKGLKVKVISSPEDLKEAFDYEVMIITAHRHRYLECFDFMGNTVPCDDVADIIPENYYGIIDISSCHSASFQMKWKKKKINATYIATNTESAIELRLFVYKTTIQRMLSHPNDNYIDAMTVALNRIKKEYKSKKTREDVFLGGSDASEETGSLMSASAFAPSEIAKGDNMMIQVYVYNDLDHWAVIDSARKSDEDARERCEVPLNSNLNNKDNVQVNLKVLDCPGLIQSKSFTWQGKVAKLYFNIAIPKSFEKNKCFVEIFMSLNNAPLCELSFATKLVDTAEPDKSETEVLTKRFKKVFISYSHLDESKVKYLDQAYEAVGMDHFFDRRYLKVGDVFPLQIKEYIKSADLFILCWSENACQSDYVKLELKQALERAYPNVMPYDKSQITLYPLSIEPFAELPAVLKENYNFGFM